MEASDKIAAFKSTKGEAAWNDILRSFESFLGCLPVAVKTNNVPGNITLGTKIHAGV